MELDTNNHSVFKLWYHLVMCVKYRRDVIDDDVSRALESMFGRIGEGYGVALVEWNHDRDHVHVLFRARPNTDLSKFLNAYKSASSRIVKKQFPRIREKLWRGAFWSQSYCLLTCGGAPIEVIRAYIEGQGGDA